MTIESFKKDKMIKPYFLWFLKSNLMMPKVIHMVILQGGEKQEGIELILSYQKAQKTLVNKLKKEGIEEGSMIAVVSEVCDHFIEEMGEKTIMESSPELLIRYDYNQN
ncbi:MAG: hypothetical protein JKY51_06875 [Opitutaceae bacterium]|nr:hypothetical protein [Opitutaceae bacterium]